MPKTKNEIAVMLEVARLYYEHQFSQQQIADKIGISRPGVSRLLQQARDTGIGKSTAMRIGGNLVSNHVPVSMCIAWSTIAPDTTPGMSCLQKTYHRNRVGGPHAHSHLDYRAVSIQVRYRHEGTRSRHTDHSRIHQFRSRSLANHRPPLEGQNIQPRYIEVSR